MSEYLCPIDCPDRNATCHIHCERHKKYRERNEQEKRKRMKEVAVKVYQVDQKNKAIKDKRNHKLWKREIRKK